MFDWQYSNQPTSCTVVNITGVSVISPAQLGLGRVTAGGSASRRVCRCRRRRGDVSRGLSYTWRSGLGGSLRTGLTVGLRTGRALTVGPRGVSGSRSVLADLAHEILVLVRIVKHILVTHAGQHLGSVSEQNDSARSTNLGRCGIESRVELVGRIVKLIVDARATELGCTLVSKVVFSEIQGQKHTVFRRRTRAISLCDPLANQAIPLFLGFAVEQSDNGHGHVVTSHSASLAIGSQAVVHHVFANMM